MVSKTDVLTYISDKPGCTSREIAANFGVDTIAVSRKTYLLEKQGHVIRSPDILQNVSRKTEYKLWAAD